MKNINNTYTKLLDEIGVYYTNSFREIVDEYNITAYLAFKYQYKRKLFEIFISKKDSFVRSNKRLEAQRHSENTKEE